MLNKTLALTALTVLVGGSALADDRAKGSFVYPDSPRESVVDTYHGVEVADPYRWLEDPNAERTKAWVEAQNKVTFGYLESIPARERIKNRLTELWNYERFSLPSKEGGRYFFSRNDGLQPQSVLYVSESLGGEARVLLDPNTYRADGTVALAGTRVSWDGKLLAYGIADAGSDWNTWRIRDIDTGKDLPDELKWVKFSGASWSKDNKGFFYSRYDAPAEDQKLKQINENQQVYYHRVGTPQSEDVLVYRRFDEPRWGFGAGVTEDGAYLVLNVSEGTDRRNRFFYRDLKARPIGSPATDFDAVIMNLEKKLAAAVDMAPTPEDKAKMREENRRERAKLLAQNGNTAHGFVELLNDFDASYDFVDNDGPVFFFLTDLDAPRGRLIAIDTRSPDRANWKTVIPQTDATLRGVSLVGGHLVATYLKDASTEFKIFDLSGTHVRDVALPGIGSAGGFGGKRDDPETFYSYSSFTTPPTIYRYDMKTGEQSVFRTSNVKFDPSQYETTRVFYTSKDGTKVPMFLTHRKGLKLDGNNPTLLYGYGGFNIPTTPGFSPSNVVWMDLGGVYAAACIRGGGEYGEEWHKAGTKLTKQNTFDDFIAAAEWLIASKYTSPSKLAIQGGSNGGLLVGAVMTQRPDLFGAALPAVGVMDMLRFHQFTIGWAWKSDYGSSENPEEFKVLKGYSPLHNLKPGTRYPSTMITTADTDDRVVPAHSFKFAAALQHAHAGDNPVLIRIETRAGHGAGTPTAKRIQQSADIYAFLVDQLDIPSPE